MMRDDGHLGKLTGRKTCLSVSISHSPGPSKHGQVCSIPWSPASQAALGIRPVFPGHQYTASSGPCASVQVPPQFPGSQVPDHCKPCSWRAVGLALCPSDSEVCRVPRLSPAPGPLRGPPSPPERMTPCPSSFAQSSSTLLRKASPGSPRYLPHGPHLAQASPALQAAWALGKVWSAGAGR